MSRRLSMRNIREVLRLKWHKGLSNRQIAKSCAISRSSVGEYITKAEEAGLCWPLPEAISDTALERMLYPAPEATPGSKRTMPSMQYLYEELKRKGVNLSLLWYEYKQENPLGYQYSYFCEQYRSWEKTLDVTLRQEHRAGEKLFVDYAGQTVPITDPKTGTVTHAQIFIACLGASNYIYAEASLTQNLHDWTHAHVNCFAFFGGVPEIVVPDNLKSGIKSPCRYEPEVNPTYQELANHYDTAVIPARVKKPKDKAKAETGVKFAETWILAALRNRTFFSLGELNQAIAEKLTELNNKKFQKLPTTRRQQFEKIDKPALKPLPERRYEYALWKKATVNIDYHVEVEKHYYSVPYQLVKKMVDVRLTSRTVEVLYKNRRVASHSRSYHNGKFTTLLEHMPEKHKRYLEWTPARIIKWAGEAGPCTKKLVTEIINSKPHPQQGYRACLGIMRLGDKRYGRERLEAACSRALAIQSYSYKSVESILKKGLDQQPLVTGPVKTQAAPTMHDNIRGKDYYRQEQEETHAE
jgi:transposase